MSGGRETAEMGENSQDTLWECGMRKEWDSS